MPATRLTCLVLLAMTLATSLIFGQTTVTTSGGSANAIAKFTGASAIGNSALLESGGNVGIGTSSPAGKLDVQGAGGLVVSGSNLDPTQGYSLVPLQNSSKLLTGWNQTASGGEIDLISNRGSGSTGGFRLYDYTNAGVLNALVTMRGDNGYVGIGASGPAGKLDVQGVGGLVVSGSNLDPTQGYSLVPLQNSGKLLTGWNQTASGGEIDLISNRGSGSTGGFRLYDYTNAGVLNALVAVRGDNGYVGIGTTGPGQRLEVNGNIQLTPGSGGIIFSNGTVQSTAAFGTITGVTVGGGLTGGGTSGNVALAVDTSVARNNINQTFNGNLTVNGTVTATHVNSTDFATVVHGNCITESFATPYVLNNLGQTSTTNCTYGPGSPINPVLGTVIPFSGVLSTLQVVQTSLSNSDNFGGQVQVYLEPFSQSGGWTVTSLTCTLTASSGNSLNSTTTCTDGTHTTSVSAGQKILVSVTPPSNGSGAFAPVAAELKITF
jgi:hypothetical protein